VIAHVTPPLPAQHASTFVLTLISAVLGQIDVAGRILLRRFDAILQLAYPGNVIACDPPRQVAPPAGDVASLTAAPGGMGVVHGACRVDPHRRRFLENR
jgi:hypothetical protein